jgi:branched-chain amino acid transport system ATP-binding protein
MLRLENFSSGYGKVRAVEGLNLSVAKGEIFTLLGPNGAGKTSTLMAIMGHVAVHAGRIVIDGEDITATPAVERVKYGLSIVPEGRQLFPDLTVDENLTVGGYTLPKARALEQRDTVFSLFPILAERRRQMAGSLSGGEQQMLAIGRALMAEPKLLLVDELSLGLMPKIVDLCFAALATLRDRGFTILMVEQNTTRALEVADNVCVLASGTPVYSGTAADTRENEEIFEKYLGVVD